MTSERKERRAFRWMVFAIPAVLVAVIAVSFVVSKL